MTCGFHVTCDFHLTCGFHVTCGLHYLDSNENPELIWNDEAREKVSSVVAKMTKE